MNTQSRKEKLAGATKVESAEMTEAKALRRFMDAEKRFKDAEQVFEFYSGQGMPIVERFGYRSILDVPDSVATGLMLKGNDSEARILTRFAESTRKMLGAKRDADAACGDLVDAQDATGRAKSWQAPAAKPEAPRDALKPTHAGVTQAGLDLLDRFGPPVPDLNPKGFRIPVGRKPDKTRGWKNAAPAKPKPVVKDAPKPGTVREYKVEPWEHKNPAPAGCRYQSRWIGGPLPPSEPWHATTPPWMDRPA